MHANALFSNPEATDEGAGQPPLAMLRDWLSMAESQICAMQVLAEQLPKVNGLLEDSFEDISGRFVSMTQDVSSMRNMMKGISLEAGAVSGKVSSANNIMDRMSDQLMALTIAMQFQDRVSQNLVITINVLLETINYLQKGIDDTICSIPDEAMSGVLDVDYSKKLLDQLKLGELRHHYVSHLLEQGYISDPADIGECLDEEEHKPAAADGDDIELF